MATNTGQALLDALRSRSSISWLRERDIDLLLCSELHGNPALCDFFRARLGWPSVQFNGAWVSLAEAEGESDLVISYGDDKFTSLVLIENKIDASFQPDQIARYAMRALRWGREANVAKVATVLLAPAEYSSPQVSAGFDARVTYEELSGVLRTRKDGRSGFLAETLLLGVEAARRGYVMNPSLEVTSMWETCWKVAMKIAPKLNFQLPGAKPGKSNWFYFRGADGFESTSWREAVVVFKAERGQADLQFGGVSAGDLASKVGHILATDMKIAKAGKSASIRVEVPRLDFFDSPEKQLERMTQGFLACERLRQFWVSHKALLKIC